ncbi:trichoplein keratin filament-binding protein-like [Mytilus trossulus]|uniref:trichoplein keratin filament-binding protein-like n=1 Tax=Mytilus trossulus TaxID=6551 RepID=UPI003003EA7D
MALPTTPRYWTTRKNIYEQAIVRHRDHNDQFRERWGTAVNYFQKSDMEAKKQSNWGSEQSMRSSMDKYKAIQDKDEKTERLKKRRLKLGQMLREERNSWEAELKGFSRDNYSRLEDMKERTDTLRSAREEKRKQLAEEKLYEYWKLNNPDLRKIESEQLKDHVVGKWSGQVEEKEQKLDQERREKEKFEKQMEEERLQALASERQKEEEKLREEIRIKDIVQEQMYELKEREHEARMLKREQDQLLKEQWELENMEEERKEREVQRKQREVGKMLLRQHKTQMMAKSRRILEELEQDRQILEAMAEQEQEDEKVQTARKETARADAAWMKQVIEDQIKLEKAREAELDMLYQEEAARMWHKREAEWEKERAARARLMHEVMDDRQRQLEDRMEQNRIDQEESLKQRELLIREMEIAQQMTHREKEETEAQKEALKLNLKEQVTARREQDERAKQRDALEFNEDQKGDEEYDDFLRQETERMRLKGFTPRQHGRKQAWS